MTYLRSLFLNFLIVFFVNRVLPGIEISSYEQAPNIGADLLFSAIVGFLNATIFPTLVLFEAHLTSLKIGVLALIISYGAYILAGIFQWGMHLTAGGVFFGGLIVWIVSFFANYLEMKHVYKP